MFNLSMEYTNMLINNDFESSNQSFFNIKEIVINSICGLSFDDEIGQIVEAIWPESSLESSSLKALCGLGFPETTIPCGEGEIKFIFRIRKCIDNNNVRF